ncbi:MAG: extracellular solute-binding protein [Pseudomonadota bacterium]
MAAPWVHAAGRPELRVLGTHVTLQEALRQRAQAELGIDLKFDPRGSARVLLRGSTRPETFDLYEQWSGSLRVLWQARTIQPIDKTRIRAWDEMNSLTKTGRIASDARLGAGDAPFRIINVQPDDTLGPGDSRFASFLPYVHNVDSYGYDTRYIKAGTNYGTESWGWLLDPRFSGQVGTVNAPTIGLFDLALAAQAQNLMQFGDIGAMTRAEIDRLFTILIDYKRRGHFSGFWNSVPESVEFMASGRVRLQSMFSPGIAALNGRGVPALFAAPREGYRAWHGIMCLSATTRGRQRDAAYEYMNWWLSGWPGAFIARQGYYISNPERSRNLLSEAEWDYWYGGEPAAADLLGTDGRVVVREGERRSGGSYRQRLSNIAVWNTMMPTYEYSLQRWYELLTA